MVSPPKMGKTLASVSLSPRLKVPTSASGHSVGSYANLCASVTIIGLRHHCIPELDGPVKAHGRVDDGAWCTERGGHHSALRPALILSAARQLPRVALNDALRICLVRRDGDPDRCERAAVLWLGRFALEARDVTVIAIRGAAEALDDLPDQPAETLERPPTPVRRPRSVVGHRIKRAKLPLARAYICRATRRPRRLRRASPVRVSAMSTIVRTGTEAAGPAARTIAIIVIAI